MKLCPSNKTDDAFPKDDEVMDPETRSMRSCSMILFAECVSCKGTKSTWVMLVAASNSESTWSMSLDAVVKKT